MGKEIEELIAEAREWASSYVSWGDNGLVDRLVDALETTIVRAERLEAQERYDVTKYRDWKRNHNPLTVSKVRKWAVEAQKEVYAGNGWITHEDYRRAVVPGNLIPVLEQVEGVVVERDAAVAALEREAAVLELRNRYGQSNGTQTWIEFQGDPHFIVNQVLAALDGVPELEMEYRVEYQVPGGETHISNTMATFEDAYNFMLWNIHGGTVMGRTKAIPAGPWLPAEGEKP